MLAVEAPAAGQIVELRSIALHEGEEIRQRHGSDVVFGMLQIEIRAVLIFFLLLHFAHAFLELLILDASHAFLQGCLRLMRCASPILLDGCDEIAAVYIQLLLLAHAFVRGDAVKDEVEVADDAVFRDSVEVVFDVAWLKTFFTGHTEEDEDALAELLP